MTVNKITTPPTPQAQIDKINEIIDAKQDVLTAGTDIEIVKGGSGILPSGFQQVEYIEGTSNVQYINTGIVPNSNMEIYGKFGVASITTGASYSAFGSRQTAGQSDGICIFIGTGSNTRVDSFFFLSNNADRWLADSVTSVGDIYETTFSNSLQTLSKNGVSLGSRQYVPANTTTQPMYINGLNNAGSLQSGQWGGRVYRFTVKGIADFIPAIRTSDNAVGMYDIIRNQFFTNAGTGNFTAGAPVGLPTGYKQVEYIESTGTQYINTGFVPKTYGIEIETAGKVNELTTTTVPVCLWGFMGAESSQPRWLVGQTIWSDNSSVWLMNLNITIPVPNITPDTNKHTFVAKVYTSGSSKYWSAKLDGVVVQDNQTVNVPEKYEANTLPIYLFARNNNGTAGNFVQGRIYSFKIYDNGTLVRDFVPCLDTNNVACLYDMVGKQTYYNAGTGTFEAGEVVGDELIINFTNESGYVLSSDLATVATSGSYNDLSNKPTIPSEVTESTVSGWGFTKNTGTVTSVNNISPVNGNVSLTIPDTSNLANKDLSNLSSTGNSKFQAPLVSGTNIKTINNNSILGSGNLVIDGLPSQTGNANKFLTTDGTDASWAAVTIPTPTYDSVNERITW